MVPLPPHPTPAQKEKKLEAENVVQISYGSICKLNTDYTPKVFHSYQNTHDKEKQLSNKVFGRL